MIVKEKLVDCKASDVIYKDDSVSDPKTKHITYQYSKTNWKEGNTVNSPFEELHHWSSHVVTEMFLLNVFSAKLLLGSMLTSGGSMSTRTI